MGGGVAQHESRPDAAAWQSASEDLLASARRAETLLAVVLGVAPAETASGDAPAQLLTALAQLSSRADQCQRLLADR
jgi:hypothetical protein